MALLKSLLPILIACVAVIGSVAGAPAPTPPPYDSIMAATETTMTTAQLAPGTTVLTVLTTTENWGVLPPSGPKPPRPGPPRPNVPVPVAVNKRLSFTTVTVVAPTDSSLVDFPVTTTARGWDKIQGMTLSLSMSWVNTTTAPMTVFADPGILGHPPTSESSTTPNFPVVPPNLPDGTKLRRSAIGIDTNASGAGPTVTGPVIIHGASASSSPVYATEIAPLPRDGAIPSKYCSDSSLGRSPASMQHYSPCWSHPSNTLYTPMKDRHLAVFPTITLSSSPPRAWHDHGNNSEQPQPTESQGSYTFPSFTNMILTPGEGTSITSQFFLSDAAEGPPTELAAPPHPQVEADMTSAIQETSSVACSDFTEETEYWPTTTICTTCGPFFAHETVTYTFN